MAFLSIDDCAASHSPGRMIRRIDKLMSALAESRMPAGDISLTQWIALKLVRDGTATNPGALARELGHTTGAVTRLIDGLEQRGLMARDRAGADRRVVRLVLTDEGLAKLMALAPIVVGAWNEVVEIFDMSEFSQLLSFLTRLLDAAERSAGDAMIEELAA